ncbi:hypothetical protein M1O19_06720 [Dehalococcoidia bacterium]|nr:hypothetical protein [Dehalococcoidia bacterium]
MGKDTLHVYSVGLTLTHRFTHDPRGTRYEVLGDTVDYRRAYVVCRFLLSGVLLIITAYVEEKY